MVIKFDHITHVVNRNNMVLTLNNYFEKGYVEIFREYGLKNNTEKKRLLKYDQMDHDICFLRDRKNEIDVEIIAYDKTSQNLKSRIELWDNLISIKTYKIEDIKQVFNLLGVKKNNNLFTWGGLLQHTNYYIEIVPEEYAYECFLDDEGLCCLTLMVDSLEKYREKLHDIGLNYSKIFQFRINNQLLDIMFVFTKNKDVIIELISKVV